jgi:hypothetical protein
MKKMFEKIRQKYRGWPFKEKHLEVWMTGFILVCAVLFILLVLFTDKVGLFVGDDGLSNRNYLLSSIIQGLATILALLVTVSVVATQLAAGTYTPRVIKHHIRSIWLWGAISIYLIAIIWAKIALSYPEGWQWFQQHIQDSIDMALILAIAALLYIIPFTLATLKSLRPESIARRLIKNKDADPINDFIRKTINDGTITVEKDILAMYFFQVISLLKIPEDREIIAKETATLMASVGKYACQKDNMEAFGAIMALLTKLVKYSSEPPRYWRQAADIFNETIKELYDYYES